MIVLQNEPQMAYEGKKSQEMEEFVNVWFRIALLEYRKVLITGFQKIL